MQLKDQLLPALAYFQYFLISNEVACAYARTIATFQTFLASSTYPRRRASFLQPHELS